MNLHIDLDWIPISERLPENGQQIFACIDIDAVDPGEAAFMRMTDKVFADMSAEDRSIQIEPGVRLEIYSNKIRPTQYVIAAYAFIEEVKDENIKYIKLNKLPKNTAYWGTEIDHGYCTTYWAPVPTTGPFKVMTDE